MFLKPESGAVRLVVTDGSTQTEEGDVTVSQHKPSSFCSANGLKPLDWLFWIKSEWTSLGWRQFSCLETFFFSL